MKAKVRVLTQKSLDDVHQRHFEYPGSVFYRANINAEWQTVPVNLGEWKAYWEFAFLELETENEAVIFAESFASLLDSSVQKEKINRHTPIHKLELSTRIYNSLRTAKIRTIGELFDYKWRSIKLWRQFGKTSEKELINKMSKYELE